MRLLYVEDEIWMARTIEKLLHQMGYDFDTADCGEVAVELATTNAYDLILLDIMLPDIDGYEVMERLREQGVETPVLIQTGLIDPDKKAQGASLGVADYLIKPFNKNQLVKAIETAIARSRQDSNQDAAIEGLSPDDDTPLPNENRQHRRFKIIKMARVVSHDVFKCVVMNMSYGGAAIRLPSSGYILPEQFKMVFKANEQRDCELCWHHGDKAGVKFV